MIHSKATFSFQTFLRLVRGVLTKSVTCVTRTLARKMTNRVYLRSDFINMPQKCVIGIYLNLKMNPNWVQCKFRLLHTVFDILREPKISVRMVFYPWLINLNIVHAIHAAIKYSIVYFRPHGWHNDLWHRNISIFPVSQAFVYQPTIYR